MKSIRTYLLLTLLATITAATFLSLLQGYSSSVSKTEALFDERLKNLAGIIVHANHDTSPRVERRVTLKPSVFFQIWSDKPELIARSSHGPDQLLYTSELSEGFHDVNYADFRWRTYVLRDALFKRWIVTGERIDLRYEIAENIVVSAIMPTLLVIPLAGLIIWLTVGFGLNPLHELTRKLSHKKIDDLSPIQIEKQPQELEQLLVSTNDLLERLNAAFIREQQFSADAAHELRTPISALKVQLHNLMLTKKLADEDIKPLKEGVERMGYVVEQILSLYQHSAEQASQEMVRLDFMSIVQRVIADKYIHFDEKQQKIGLDGDGQCFINGNEFALESLVENVILNANKYAPVNGVVSVGVQTKNDYVELCVEDSGPGIVAEDRERVFERFYRAGGDQHASGVIGCGLGLAIVNHISSMHQASINLGASSELGGLKVTIRFPAA